MISRIVQYAQKQSIIFFTATYLLLSLTAWNNKIFIFYSVFFYLGIFWKTRSFIQTLLFSFLPFYLFRAIGKTYVEELIPSSQFFSTVGSGFTISMVISPFVVLLIVSICSLALFLIRYKRLYIQWTIVFFSAFVLWKFFSSWLTQFFPLVSLYYVFFSFGILVFMIEMYIVFQTWKKKDKDQAIFILYHQLFLLLIYQISIGILQCFHSGTVGFLVEQVKDMSMYGNTPDTYGLFFLYRPSGVSSHTTGMVFQVMDMGISTALLFVLFFRKQKKNISSFFFLWIGIFILIILSQNRTSYVVISILTCIFGFLFWKETKQFLYSFFFRFKPLYRFFFISLCAFLFFFIVVPRILASIGMSWSSGGVLFRQTFTKEAIDIIRIHPLFGVGSGMFVPANLALHPFGINYEFPHAVHNQFLLLAAESGIPALLFYICGIAALFGHMTFFRKKEVWFAWCAILGLFFIAYFHALERLMPLSIILLFLVTSYEKDHS